MEQAVVERFSVTDGGALPAIGPAGGGLSAHYLLPTNLDMARGYFIVPQLERGYGAEALRELYDCLPQGCS